MRTVPEQSDGLVVVVRIRHQDAVIATQCCDGLLWSEGVSCNTTISSIDCPRLRTKTGSLTEIVTASRTGMPITLPDEEK